MSLGMDSNSVYDVVLGRHISMSVGWLHERSMDWKSVDRERDHDVDERLQQEV